MPPAVAGRESEPIAVRLEAETGEPIPALEARKSRRLALLAAAEERLEGKVEPLERYLRRLGVNREERRILGADSRQALALVGERDRYARLAIGLDALLEGGIIQHAMQGVQALKRNRLRLRRVQLVCHAPIDPARHASYLVVMNPTMSSLAGFFICLCAKLSVSSGNKIPSQVYHEANPQPPVQDRQSALQGLGRRADRVQRRARPHPRSAGAAAEPRPVAVCQ